MKNIGLIAHAAKPGAAKLVQALCDEFARCGATIKLEQRTAALVDAGPGLSTVELGRVSDILLVLGGDGTILQVLHELGEEVKPVFGINLGSLGFLTCVSSVNYLDAVRSILNENYCLSSRSLLHVEIHSAGSVVANRTGLNDAVITRGEISRLIKLEARVDDSVLTEYNADGLIIATATGSTAYSLSAGGPVLAPDSGVFVITPICPHVLTNRSFVVSDAACISVKPLTSPGSVFVSVDGQDMDPIRGGDIVKISKARHSLQLAMLPEMSYFEVLRQKLKWSGTAV